MSASLFRSMTQVAHDIILHQWHLSPEHVILVSGGVAWSDHVAVRLYLADDLKFAGLELHLPVKLADDTKSGDETGWPGCENITASGKRDGGILNYWHTKFAERLDMCDVRGTLLEIRAAMHKGARIYDAVAQEGFLQRNTRVAQQSDYLVAFTWSPHRDRPLKGGTYDTWQKSARHKSTCTTFANSRVAVSCKPPCRRGCTKGSPRCFRGQQVKPCHGNSSSSNFLSVCNKQPRINKRASVNN